MPTKKPNDTAPADLTARDRELAAHLAAGLTHDEAAEKLAVSRATVSRTVKKPGFRELVAELRTAAAEQIAGGLLEASREALAELRRLIREATSKDGPKVAAIRAALEFALRFRDCLHHDEVVRQLEADVQELRDAVTRAAATTPAAAPPVPEVRAHAPADGDGIDPLTFTEGE